MMDSRNDDGYIMHVNYPYNSINRLQYNLVVIKFFKVNICLNDDGSFTANLNFITHMSKLNPLLFESHVYQ